MQCYSIDASRVTKGMLLESLALTAQHMIEQGDVEYVD